MSLPVSRSSPLPWLAALSLLAAAVYLPLLGYLPLYLEEPRRALIAAHMLYSGDYLTPVYAGQVYLAKPPLFNWLICAASWPFGVVSAESARLPSVLALWLLMLFLVGCAWRRLGGHGALFWGCALLLSPEILLKGRLAEIDLVFACLVAASLWGWLLLDQAGRRGLLLWLPPLLLVVLAYLTKREPALVFFYLTVGPYLALRGRMRELWAPGHWLASLLVTLPILAWLAALAARVGWEPLWQSLLHEVLLRGEGTNPGRYLEHILSYPLEILGACAPFSLLLLPLLSEELRRAVRARHGELARFAAVAVLANLPLYWLKGDLPVRYFLPMFPFLLLLAAMSYETLLADLQAAGPRWAHVLNAIARALFWSLPMVALLLATTPILPKYQPDLVLPLPWPVPLGGALLVLGGLWPLRKLRPLQRLLPAMVAWMLLLRGIEFNAYLPLKAQALAHTQNAPAIVADLVRRLPAGRPLFVSQRIPSAVWFYAPQGLLRPLGDGAGFADGDQVLLHAELPPPPGTTLEEIAHYRYENDNLCLAVVQRR